MVLLVEYYKYHNEIPRFFMPKLSDQLSKYEDRMIVVTTTVAAASSTSGSSA